MFIEQKLVTPRKRILCQARNVKVSMGLSDYHETEIIDRLKAGDVWALNFIMDRYKDDLYRLAYRIIGNAEDAEELLQDTFLRAYKKIDSFEGRSRFSTWLYRICVNLCLNKKQGLKKRLSKWARQDLADRDLKQLTTNQDPHDEMIKTEMQERISRGVAELKPYHRAVVSLYYLQGFSCSEIGEILKKPLNSVKTDLHRARKKLQEMLVDLEE